MKLKKSARKESYMKRFNRITKLDHQIRAPFIVDAIIIDGLVSDIIASHFCDDTSNREELFSLVLNGGEISFSQKIGMLSRIMKKHYPNMLRQAPKLIDTLEKIRKFRNRMAHAMYDSSPDYVRKSRKNEIQLVFFEGGMKKTQVVTKTESRIRSDQCFAVILDLVNVKGWIQGFNEDLPEEFVSMPAYTSRLSSIKK
jgi:uncharacterized Fe-S cluster-containing protein